MNRIYFIALIAVVAFGCSTKKTENKRPNIILIMADDYGAEDVKSYNPNTPLNTPNIDKLAKNGVQFKACYTTPLCGPSRALIMSGQHPQKTGHWCNNGYFNEDHEDFPYDLVNDISFYRTLQESGYKTAVTGKWDGDKGFMPKYFDEACVWPRQVKFIPKDADYKGVTKTDDPIWKPASRYWQPFVMKNGKFLETEAGDFGPDIFSDFVLDFASRHKDSKEPFFVYYPMVLPHNEPTAITDKGKVATPVVGKPGEKTEVSYAAMKNYIDFIVGKIKSGLKEEGLDKNTIVIFTGDNGSYGHHGKGTTFEPGVWVPFIVNCPELIAPRGMVDELVSHVDVLPTLAVLAGATIPEKADGISIVPVLEGKQGERDHIYSYLGSERIIRTHRYLLEKNHEDFEGFFYDSQNVIAGSATEEFKEAYIDLTNTKDSVLLAEKQRLIKLMNEKYPAPKGIPISGKEKVAAQRAYDKSTGLYK